MGSKMGILRYIVVGAVAFALLPTPPVSENKQGEALHACCQAGNA
jgi:hypothetical protein